MVDGALVVFTAKTVEQILGFGGTRSWVLNPSRMGHIRYVVCTRNADRKYDTECGPRTEPHRSAFLVGKISGIRKVDRHNGRDRYLIEFSEYALLDPIPEFRGHERNPVTYSDADALRIKGLDVDKLEFQPMPQRDSAPLPLPQEATKGLSIAQAKEGLATFFGVRPENVQITISG